MHNETLDQLGLTLSDWHVLTALRWSRACRIGARRDGSLAERT